MPHIMNITRFLAQHPYEPCYEALVLGRKVLVTDAEAHEWGIDLSEARPLL